MFMQNLELIGLLVLSCHLAPLQAAVRPRRMRKRKTERTQRADAAFILRFCNLPNGLHYFVVTLVLHQRTDRTGNERWDPRRYAETFQLRWSLPVAVLFPFKMLLKIPKIIEAQFPNGTPFFEKITTSILYLVLFVLTFNPVINARMAQLK